MEILVIGDGTGDIHDNIQVYSPILQVCTHPAMSPEHTHPLQIHTHCEHTPKQWATIFAASPWKKWGLGAYTTTAQLFYSYVTF